jgi:diacylglycerol kinase (ATP)
MKFEKPDRFNIIRAFKNSFRGCCDLWRHEKAFRTEIYLSIPFILVLWYLNVSGSIKITLVLLFLFLLVIEAINSAIEAVVDRISLELHEQSRLAKDMGSAAVGIAVLMNIIMWAVAIVLHFS